MRVAGSSTSVPAVSRVGRGCCVRREQGAQSGRENDEGERLGEEVVGAGVERLRLVPLPVLRREHEYRGPDALLAERLADLEAVHPRQEDVEDDHCVAPLAGPPEPVEAVVDGVDVEALGGEAAGYGLGERNLVLYQQHTHDLPIVAREGGWAPPILSRLSVSSTGRGGAAGARHPGGGRRSG